MPETLFSVDAPRTDNRAAAGPEGMFCLMDGTYLCGECGREGSVGYWRGPMRVCYGCKRGCRKEYLADLAKWGRNAA